MNSKLFQLKLDVPGQLGERTVWGDPTKVPGVRDVLFAHLELHDWHGDCLVKASPVYIITSEAYAALEAAHVTGISAQRMEISVGEPYEFSNSPPSATLPQVVRLLPTGRTEADRRRPKVRSWSGHDVSDSNIGLVVTQRALEVLRTFGLERAIARPLALDAID